MISIQSQCDKCAASHPEQMASEKAANSVVKDIQSTEKVELKESSANTKDTVENVVVEIVETTEVKEATAEEAAFLKDATRDKMCSANMYAEKENLGQYFLIPICTSTHNLKYGWTLNVGICYI